jgi:hypothetical protein
MKMSLSQNILLFIYPYPCVYICDLMGWIFYKKDAQKKLDIVDILSLMELWHIVKS